MGIHRGGYDAFTYDITKALKKGGGEQEIVVSVWDPTDNGDQPRGKQTVKPHGIWYTSTTGIWQTVWLEPVSETHIDDLKIVPDVDGKCVRVTPTVKGGSEQVTVKVMAGGKEIATKSGAAGSEIVLPVEDAHLWSPSDPYLYDLQVSAGDDSVKSYFGMRKVEVKKDEKGLPRILLNGKAVFEVGMLDQGFWPDGLYTPPSDEAMKFDIVEQKKLGFNLIRKHIKFEPARWYYWTDKLGMLVWQDMPSGNNKTDKSKEEYERELKRLIETHWNHPSIIMWVVFNEGWGQYDTVRVTEIAKQLDPTRLANNASGWTDAGAGDVVDMHLYPGPGIPKGDGKRAAVLGEFGGLGLLVPGHQWWDKHFNYSAQSSPEELVEQYTRLLSRAWQLRDEGLNALIYTQTTDVEGENNGLMTYDRILKADAEKLRLATTGEGPRIETVTIAPTAMDAAVEWHYTTDKPASDEWTSAGFDDSGWKVGAAGFGTGPRPVGKIRTEWKSSDIWARREIELPSDVKPEDLRVALQHDDGCEVYLNGELAVRRRNSDSSYEEQPIRKEALATLKMGGKNVLAVHCKNDGGEAYIDAGIVRLVERSDVRARDGAK
jgi:beta-galactosidase/beta-glucuronidase